MSNNIGVYPFLRFSSYGRRPTRYDSVGCDEREVYLPQRSAEGLLARRGGGGMNFLKIIPPPLRSSPYVRGTILGSG